MSYAVSPLGLGMPHFSRGCQILFLSSLHLLLSADVPVYYTLFKKILRVYGCLPPNCTILPRVFLFLIIPSHIFGSQVQNKSVNTIKIRGNSFGFCDIMASFRLFPGIYTMHGKTVIEFYSLSYRWVRNPITIIFFSGAGYHFFYMIRSSFSS